MSTRSDKQRVEAVSAAARKAAPALLMLLLLQPLSVATAAEERGADRDASRIVAIGDVHGNLDNFLAILRQTGIVDEQGNWTAGSDIFVQTGDLIDRGPDDMAVLELILKLEKQARQAGGQVVSLLGNHEGMNVLGDLRYVSPESYADFADADSPRRQAEYLDEFIKFRKQRAKKLGKPEPVFDAARTALWRAKHPTGFVEHRDAFGAKGRYGKWLRDRPALALVGEVAFLHGGVSPQLAQLSLKEINKRVRNEFRSYDTYRKTLVGQGIILEYYTVQEMIDAVRDEFEFQKQRDPSQVVSRALNPNQAMARHRHYVDLLRGVLGYGSWFVNSPIGPLWFRGYAKWEEAEGTELLPEIADRFRAKAFVVGHTPQLKQGIRPRFEGKVMLIDTGLNNDYYKGGTPSALEIVGGDFVAVYVDGRRQNLTSAQASLSSQGR